MWHHTNLSSDIIPLGSNINLFHVIFSKTWENVGKYPDQAKPTQWMTVCDQSDKYLFSIFLDPEIDSFWGS